MPLGDAVDRSEQFLLVEHSTFSVSDNSELGFAVFLAVASNSIGRMKKIVTAFRKGGSSLRRLPLREQTLPSSG